MASEEDSVSVHLRKAGVQQSHDRIGRYSAVGFFKALLDGSLSRRDLFGVLPLPLHVVSSAVLQLTEMDGAKASRSRVILGQCG